MVEGMLLKFFEITFLLLHQQLMIVIFQQQIQENAEEIWKEQAKSQRWEQFVLVWKPLACGLKGVDRAGFEPAIFRA